MPHVDIISILVLPFVLTVHLKPSFKIRLFNPGINCRYYLKVRCAIRPDFETHYLLGAVQFFTLTLLRIMLHWLCG